MRGDGRILDVGDDKASLVGYSVDLLPPTTPNSTKLTGILQVGSKDVGDAELLTITLHAELVEPGGLPSYEDLKALIDWGTGSVTHSVSVDFLHGTMLSVDATFVKIVAAHEVATLDPQIPYGYFGNRWRVGASLAYGSRPSHCSGATTTVRPLTTPLAPNDFVAVSVAQFAVAIEVFVSPTDAIADLEGNDAFGAMLFALRMPSGSSLRVPVVGGQSALLLRNRGASPIQSAVFRQILVL